MSGSIFGDAGLSSARAGAFTMAPLLSGQRFGTRAVARTTAAITANRLYATPFIAPESCGISSSGLRVAAGAAGLCKVGLYANDPATNRPGALLGENTADLDTTSIASIFGTFTPAVSVAGGALIWAVAVFNATPTIGLFDGVSGAQSGGLFWPVGTNNAGSWLAGGVTASFYRTTTLTYVSGPTPFFPATFGACTDAATNGSPYFEFVKA